MPPRPPRKPPPELLKERPALAFEDEVQHPSTGPMIGPPPMRYTRAVHDRIIEELKKGQRAQGACARAGITVATFYTWIQRGKAGDPHLWEFAQDVEIAYNSAEADAVEQIAGGFNDVDPEKRDPELAKWFLERTRADGYSKQVRALVDTQIQDFMQRLEAALEPALFERVLAIYLGQSPSADAGRLPAHAPTETST